MHFFIHLVSSFVFVSCLMTLTQGLPEHDDLNVVGFTTVKKSAMPLTSSCAPSVTSTAPTLGCLTAASTPRYESTYTDVPAK